MGVFWNSEAEVITNNKDKANEILKYINGIDTAHENYSFFDVDLSDCSIRFSSRGMVHIKVYLPIYAQN